jgi:hypothetical protein
MASIKIRAAHPSHVQFGRRLTEVQLPLGLPSYDRILDELQGYCEVLLGHKDPPVESPYLSLMEVAAAYHGRACEIEMLIFTGEQNGTIKRGDPHYKLRNGQLEAFKSLTRKMFDLGSRRLTQEDLLTRQRLDAGERL